jgi:spermidine synthase
LDLWFSENHTENIKLSIKVDKQLYSGESRYQRIDVFESFEFGRFLTLDGIMMLTEKDEFIYHEMITHTAFAVNPDIKNILVIGAGDGGVVRELVKYNHIEHVDLVEIDEQVVEVCKKYMPTTSCALDNEKLTIYYQDGLKFIRKCQNKYDLIIVDSTDPLGPGEVLFTREFYGSCAKVLNEDGILINQHESPFYELDAAAMQRAHKRICEEFPIGLVYQAHIPTYPSGHWLFGFASKTLHPLKDLKADLWNNFKIKTKYYNTDLHSGSFALPNYVKELLNNAKQK